MKELAEIKNLIDAAKKGQIQARNEFTIRLESLGFSLYGEGLRFPHPTEGDKTVVIEIQTCYLSRENGFEGYWQADVLWDVPHSCTDDCEFGCQEEYDTLSRPATAEEIIEVLRRALSSRLEEAEDELKRDWELAKALPTEEELTKLRRDVEEYLRHNRRSIPAVAKLLKLI